MRKVVLSLVFQAIFSLPLIAQAGYIQKDLFTEDDGLLTYDTVSKREWLDLTATTNISYNGFLADEGGWLSEGFKVASITDIEGLFSSEDLAFGVLNSSVGDPTGYHGVSALARLLGETAPNLTSAYDTYGLVTDLQDDGGRQLVKLKYNQYSASGTIAGASYNDDGLSRTSGIWLYRETTVDVPEPSTLTLLSLGLLGLGFGRKRRLN